MTERTMSPTAAAAHAKKAMRRRMRDLRVGNRVESLERSGVDLTAEPVPVANRESVTELLATTVFHCFDNEEFGLSATHASAVTDALVAAGVFRDEATVKAEALEEAVASGEFPGLTLAREWIAARAASLRAGETS